MTITKALTVAEADFFKAADDICRVATKFQRATAAVTDEPGSDRYSDSYEQDAKEHILCKHAASMACLSMAMGLWTTCLNQKNLAAANSQPSLVSGGLAPMGPFSSAQLADLFGIHVTKAPDSTETPKPESAAEEPKKKDEEE